MSQEISSLSEKVQNICMQAARDWNLQLHKEGDQRMLAQHILRLSDHFIQNPQATTPWEHTWAQQAYAFYFLPLNTLRLSWVLQRIQAQLAAVDFSHIVDFGAGLATFSRLWTETDKELILIESTKAPQNLLQKWDANFARYRWFYKTPDISVFDVKSTLACFSYSLTELKELPSWATKCQALLIVEPSTQQDGRELLKLREKLFTLDYEILAPCTHQEACPLLHQSKNDWCHDRCHVKLPDWLEQIENYLPMKNRTLTASYLLAVKKGNKNQHKQTSTPKVRVTGDLLKEKGKDRQLICRGPEREYLAWMHKNGSHTEFARGDLIEMPENIIKVSNELRVSPK